MADSASAQSDAPARSRRGLSRGLTTVLVATVAIYALGFILPKAGSSVHWGTVQTALQFAAILAIVALGQTLVVQQGGIDLSIQGSMSLVIVIVTHYPDGSDGKLLPAVLLALVVALGAGVVNGILVGVIELNPIVATLGTNALLYGLVLRISGGTPRTTTDRLAHIAGGKSLGIPNAVYFAVAATIVVTALVKLTVAGRRFEGVGANPHAALTSGLRVKGHRAGGYVWAQVLYWLGGVIFAGVVTQPTAYQGDTYLLPSVAAVVLGGTSLLGGRGNLVATAVAALFLIQLEQFVLALGVSFAWRTIVQAVALAIGVALYTVDWRALVGRRLAQRRSGRVASTT